MNTPTPSVTHAGIRRFFFAPLVSVAGLALFIVDCLTRFEVD